MYIHVLWHEKNWVLLISETQALIFDFRIILEFRKFLADFVNMR